MPLQIQCQASAFIWSPTTITGAAVAQGLTDETGNQITDEAGNPIYTDVAALPPSRSGANRGGDTLSTEAGDLLTDETNKTILTD